MISIRIDTQVYVVQPDGWCPALGCYVRRLHDGTLVMIPADHPPADGGTSP